MKEGEKSRKVGSTNMNERSSRSHTIFRLRIESSNRLSDDETITEEEEDEGRGGQSRPGKSDCCVQASRSCRVSST